MPQMSPMNWLLLLFYFQVIYEFLLVLLYFNFFNFQLKKSKYFYIMYFYKWY